MVFQGLQGAQALFHALHDENPGISQTFVQTYLYQSDHRDNTGTDLIISGLEKTGSTFFIAYRILLLPRKSQMVQEE
jgi:hypothetical protein